MTIRLLIQLWMGFWIISGFKLSPSRRELRVHASHCVPPFLLGRCAGGNGYVAGQVSTSHVTAPPSVPRAAASLRILVSMWCGSSSSLSRSQVCFVVSRPVLICISPMTNSVEQIFMCLFFFFMSSMVKCVQIFCPLLQLHFVLLSLTFESL